MGYKERSFGMVQALIEMNVFAPGRVRRIIDQKQRFIEFKAYWEDYLNAKTGETHNLGGWDAL